MCKNGDRRRNTWADLKVCGAGSNATSVAPLGGEDPWEPPEKPPCFPERTHTSTKTTTCPHSSPTVCHRSHTGFDPVVSPSIMVSMSLGSTVGSVKRNHTQIGVRIKTLCFNSTNYTIRSPLAALTRPYRTALGYVLTRASGSEPEASVLEDI